MGKKGPLLLFLFLFCCSGKLLAQTDTEFWFVAPRVTTGHGFDPNNPGFHGGRKFYFRFASMSLPADIRIEMPANPLFTPIEINLPPNTAHTEDVSDLFAIIWHEMPNAIEDRGVRITSTTPITAYYEVGTFFNPDIFSLKGRNALGTEFYVPFQNTYRNGNYNPRPFSTINIVATQDNTLVRIIPTRNAYSGDQANPHLAGDVIEVVLNRGQTFAVAPNYIFPPGAFPLQGQLPENRLVGTKVVSNHPIAITVSDDSVDAHPQGTCKDLIGDQLVPVHIIGTEYIAMRGRLNLNMQESAYVLATQNNTEIFVDGAFLGVIHEGQTQKIHLINQVHHIKTTHPSYVFHVAGFGCEMGGAVLPPVDFCNGSSQISFTRSKEGANERFFLNILVRAGAEDGFILNGNPALIPAAAFVPVPGTTQWLAAEFEFTAQIPTGVASFIENTKDLFHLGIINGGPNSGTMYGYFSDFNQVEAATMIVESGTDFEAICYGQTVQLYASGGINYVWSPPDFLDDPFSKTPVARPDTTMHYTVIASGACGLVDSASVTVRVTEPLYAIFNIDQTIGCSPLEINIENESIGVEIYEWWLGDGTSLNVGFDKLKHVYVNNTDNELQFDVVLVGRNHVYCVDSMRTTITVYPEIKARASQDVISGCAPLEVQFSNLSHGAETFLWKFGDGATSVAFEPVHTFHNYSDKDTTYMVVLRARSRFGCEDYDTLYVQVLPYIKAAFEFDPPQHCQPYELRITNNSYGVTQYVWSFDDGHPVQNYSDSVFYYTIENYSDVARTHTIQLSVTNDYGCSDMLERQVTVFPFIKAEFTPNIIEGCNPLMVHFENLSVGAAFYEWNFGNGMGTSSEEEPMFEFFNPDPNDPAVFNVVLMARSEYGCLDSHQVQITVFPRIKAEFSFDYSEYCAPQEVFFNNQSIGATSYLWDFGDGVSSNSPAGVVSHFYHNNSGTAITYDISLRVENDFGCWDEKFNSITIYPEVIARLEMETSGCHPLEVNIINQSLGANEFYWDFGDGATAVTNGLTSQTRTYANESPLNSLVYHVRLIAVSVYHCRDSIEVPVVVFPKPVASLEIPNNQGCAPLEISFIDHSVGHSLNQWFFGDGVYHQALPGNLQRLYHNETEEVKTYQPKLVVLNEHGCSDTITTKVMVFPKVHADISFSSLAGCHPFEVEIQNLSRGATATTPFVWDYGDGTTSIEEGLIHLHTFTNFSHTQSAFYTTLMRAENIYGCYDSVQVMVEVFPRPKALFDAPVDPGCSPFHVQFDDLSLGASRYNWSFGNGRSSTEAGSVSSTFVQPAGQGIGWFTVRLEVENQYGCDDTLSRQVAAYPAILADFSGDLQGCHPLTIEFVNFTQGGDFFTWDFEDGVFTNEPAPKHTFFNNSFTDPKNFQVNLMAESEFGCKSEIKRTITVYPRPKSDFDLNLLQGCSPLEVEIDNNSIGANKFNWTLGSEHSDNASASFNWVFRNLTDTVATIPVVLKAANQWNCDRTFSQTVRLYPEVNAEFTTSTGEFEGCTPLSLDFVNQTIRANQYVWDFDDNTLSIGVNPGHVFYAFNQETTYYDVLLKASSPYGCQDSVVKKVTVYPQPVADFAADPYIQTYPATTVVFENQSLPGQWTYTWNLDDGTIKTFSQDPGSFAHTYQWANNDYSTRYYYVNLKVENPWCEDNITRQVVILAPKPVVNFHAADKGCPPFEVNFSNNSLYGLSYLWDFDDGTTSTEKNPRHIFKEPGVYDVKLLVFGEGGVDSTYHQITVHQPPIADFRVMPDKVTLPHEPIQLVNLSSFAHWWEWDFGDGNISYEYEPLHYYQQVGVYDIRLTVGNNTDPVCYDTMIKEGAVGAEEDCVMYFPNAFTPNVLGPSGGQYDPAGEPDPLNQIFHPVFTGIEDYTLEIYTRWGELVFRTEDLDKGWDGYYRGKLSKMDVYIWKVWYTCAGTGRKVVKAGDVTLIR